MYIDTALQLQSHLPLNRRIEQDFIRSPNLVRGKARLRNTFRIHNNMNSIFKRQRPPYSCDLNGHACHHAQPNLIEFF